MDLLATDLKAVGEAVNDVQDTLARGLEPKDTINAVNVGPLGQQHGTCLRGTRLDVLKNIRV